MTPEQTRVLIGRLRRLSDATKNGRPFLLPEGTVTRLDLVERRLLAAVARNLTPGPERDGYPSGHMGGGSGKEEDVDYHPDSSVQHAAFSRLGPHPKDPLNENVTAACRHLEAAVNELAALTVRLDHIDDLANPGSRHSNPGGSCLACDRHVEGTSEDRLRRGMCHTCYTAWLRAGRPDIMQFRQHRGETAA